MTPAPPPAKIPAKLILFVRKGFIMSEAGVMVLLVSVIGGLLLFLIIALSAAIEQRKKVKALENTVIVTKDAMERAVANVQQIKEQAVAQVEQEKEQTVSEVQKEKDLKISEVEQELDRRVLEFEQQITQSVTETQQDYERRIAEIEQEKETAIATILKEKDVAETEHAQQISELTQQFAKYQPIIDIETELAQLKADRDMLITETSDAEAQIESLEADITTLEDISNLQVFGLYEPKYDFSTSIEYKTALDDNRTKQKQMIRDNTAILCPTDWTVEGSRTRGKQLQGAITKLMARAFNGECDSIIQKVRYNNYYSIEKRINTAYKAINKLGEHYHCAIVSDYLIAKIDELRLVHEYEEKRQIEMEEQRRIRDQIRDEERAIREIEKTRQEAEKEEERYQQALNKARQEIEQATGAQQDKLNAEIAHLNTLLLEAQQNKERALSRAQMTKSGHVYIISNIGSFGDNVYKIGMTRRLEPTDRVKELGDASVPFRFDIHAMIFSEDAPTLENAIHNALIKRSVNRINTRKEFFHVTLQEIENIVQQQDVTADFIRIPDAKEFRETQALLALEQEQDAP